MSVGSLKKLLAILEIIRESPTGLRLKELSERSGIHKSTAYRLLTHLEREGYLGRDEWGIYTIGIKFLELAVHGNWARALRSAARPFLYDLQKGTSETVNLAILNADTMLYVEVLETPHTFRLVSTIGMRRPVHCTALGKALAAFHPEKEEKRLLRSLSFHPFTPHTIRNRAKFRKELAWVREWRYALDNEETVMGARCIGAPIFNSKQESIAAVSIAGPISRISDEKIFPLAEAVKEAARAISARVGFSRGTRAQSPYPELLDYSYTSRALAKDES